MLAMLVFASFSVFISTFIISKMGMENLKNFSNLFVAEMESCESVQDVKTWFDELKPSIAKISVYDLDGNVVLGNTTDNTKVKNKNHLKKFKTLELNDSFYTNYSSVYYNNDRVVAAFIKKQMPMFGEDPIMLCIEIRQYYNSYYMRYLIPFTIAGLVILLVITYFFVNTVIKNALQPITRLNENLVKISNGDYQIENISTRYREVQLIADEVNSISARISNNVKFLKYEKAKSNFILDNMSQGIIAIDINGEIVMANKVACDIFDFDKLLFGEKIDKIVKDEKLLAKIQENKNNQVDQMFEYDISGKTYRVELKNIYDNWYDNKSGFIVMLVFTDVTFESQTAKIRSEFFANASHELRTPLTSIKGYSELMQISNDENARKKCISEITKNANEMLALVSDMLEISRMESEVNDDDREVLDLREIAENVIEKVTPIAQEKNVSLFVDGNGKIFGNKTQIGEVFMNLIDNAIKYNNPNGYVKVQIEQKEENVDVTVSDNGIGIDKAHHARIFERFYRVNKGRDKKVPSTGLGLAIVKHIVNIHSGKIGIKSKLGVGTIFEMSFPCVDKADIL